METTFIAKLSKTAFIITLFFNIILLSILFVNPLMSNYHLPLSTIFILFLPILTHLLHPSSYTIYPDRIRINRIIQPISISAADILQIETIQEADLAANVRLLGSGGVWGYFGIFYSTTHGKLIMMASDMEHLILIVTPHKKYVISPQDPLLFLDTYAKRKNSRL